MGRNKDRGRQKPFRLEMVRGEPYHVGGRTLTPVARVVSFGRARATIGGQQIGGWGGGFVHVQPVALEEETDDGLRRIVISDPTTKVLRGFLATAVGVTLLFAAIRWLARRRGRFGVQARR